jgi:exosortase
MTSAIGGKGTGFRVAVGIVVAALAAVYVPVMLRMGRVWWNDSYAGHGMFVPFFSAHFFWIDRQRIRASVGGRDDRGLLLVLAGIVLLVLGHGNASLVMQGLSFVVVLSGIVLWGFGARTLRAAAFPLGFLFLMVPLPRVLVAAVTLDLQLFAAGFAGLILSLLDVPFALRGVSVELPVLTLEVAEVCNGLRFLSALVVLTLAFAEVSQRTVMGKVILTLAAIPVAIVANAVRVTAIVLAVQYIGPQAASGFIHHAIGKSVWAVTILALVGLGLLLRRGGGLAAAVSEPATVVAQADPAVPGR